MRHHHHHSRHISLRFNGHFPGKPGLTGGAKDDGSGGVNRSYKTCKAAIKLSITTTFYRPNERND